MSLCANDGEGFGLLHMSCIPREAGLCQQGLGTYLAQCFQGQLFRAPQLWGSGMTW